MASLQSQGRGKPVARRTEDPGIASRPPGATPSQLGRTLGQPYEFVQRRTYGEINDLLQRGELDLAFICSGGYVALPKDAPIEIIALPVVNGKSVYHSLIVVRDASPIQRFEDLEGLRVAFTDPLSSTGYLYPVFRVAALGKDPRTFFASVLFSGSHDRSIQAVLRGLVDAAAVNELVYNHLVVPHSEYWAQLRVIETSKDFGMPPVVAPRSVPAVVRTRMREFLLHLVDTPEGRKRLAALGVDGFKPGGSEFYDSVREIREATRATRR
ncbi:MAG: phosphate/phosphite/phosphonate ABC transporter substrate-binding protein [Deltaproteobacteria bacterium]|nr:phosphate/phosphite/phosphonate ABC transporter substrate-binding protein [Deltaproteobacteria bacterium]